MNTNINPSDLPDIDALAQLANQFFSELPGGYSVQGFAPTAVTQLTDYSVILNQSNDVNKDMPMSTPYIGSRFNPPSVSGLGVSPAGFQQNGLANSGYPQAHYSDPFLLGVQTPPTVGVLSTVNQGNPVNENNPFTNIPNPNALGSPISPSISGVGVSTSVLPQGGSGFNRANPFGNISNLQGLDGLTPPSVTSTEFNLSAINGFQSSRSENVLPDPQYAGVGKVPPSVAGSGISPSAVEQHNEVNLKNPQTSHHDPHFTDGKIPQSVAGSGVSPSAQNQENIYKPNGYNTPLPDPNYAGSGKAPPSVAGSGISPSAVEQHNGVNLENPQTSHRDPHFAGGQVSQNNTTTSVNQQKNKTIDFPFANESSYEAQLKEVLSTINTFVSTPQLPHTPSGLTENSFYFLSNKFPLPSVKEPVLPQNNGQNKSENTGFQRPPFDANLIKKDFPILQERVNGKPLIWLDNAATTQKPQQVIDRISYFYEHENSNIHRAAHELAARATDAYEGAREKVRGFLNAASTNEIVFVRGTTEAINLVAQSWGEQNLRQGDEIIVSHLEHHANIVPWQLLAAKKGLKLRVIPVDDDGQILLNEYAKLLNPRTRLVSFTHVSNALGTITPAKIMIEMARSVGAKVLLDGAQSVSHMKIDVQSLNPDWFVFSGHKVFAPTGIGALYGKEALLNETQPWQGGGNMIADVTFEHTKYHNAPTRFEAGTGNIADAVGLGAAIDYVHQFGMETIGQYEHYLLLYATKLMKEVPGLRLIGTANDKASVLSFILKGYTNDEVGQALNQEGIAVRTGHHCAQPILRRFGLESTVRPSLAFYNTCSDVDALITVLHRLSSKR